MLLKLKLSDFFIFRKLFKPFIVTFFEIFVLNSILCVRKCLLLCVRLFFKLFQIVFLHALKRSIHIHSWFTWKFRKLSQWSYFLLKFFNLCFVSFTMWTKSLIWRPKLSLSVIKTFVCVFVNTWIFILLRVNWASILWIS